MRKGIYLKERHRHSGKDCELYFVPKVEPWSISPTTFTKRDLYQDLIYFCGIRWLSQGEMPRGEKIANFSEKNINATEFCNQE